MAFLIIAGITVPVLEGQAVQHVERGGSSTRAFAGNLRSQWRYEKRAWQVTTGLLTNTEDAALRTAVALAAQVTCSGDALGGSVTCEVEVADDGYTNTTTTDATGVMRSLALLLREV
jgi:hypothetical protein